jgi:Mg2+-importing ATPase
MSASLCLGTAIALPFLPFAPTLGFSTPPPGILMVTAALVATYLLCAEALKRVAMR